MDISLDPDTLNQLNGTEARALHHMSNELSSYGIGSIIDLPQLIVVGQQSAGKSSVLEAISRIRFPVQDGACTRFATELVFRHADDRRMQASIKFADASKPIQKLDRTDFSEDALKEIIQSAKERMGLPPSGPGFSKDVLRLELEGPDMYPLTIIDLPGLFSNATEHQTLEDSAMVDELVNSYARQRNSIILVVVAAGDVANHGALRWVNEVDVSRERTLGIITKPDRLDSVSAEASSIRLAKNEEPANKLALGWHVLRNLGESEAALKRDDVEHNFFSTGTWKNVPRDLVGVSKLREKLSKILYEHLRSSLPRVMQDIEARIEQNDKMLEQIGEERSEEKDMRKFLLKVASQFQWLARDGIEGRYNRQFFGGLNDEDRKLRAQLRNLSRVFDHIIQTKGSKRVLADGNQDYTSGDHKRFIGNIPVDENSDGDYNRLPEYLATVLEIYPYRFDEPEVLTSSELRNYLNRQAAANQGQEFPGLPKNDLVIQLFREQATPWKSIAESYIEHVVQVTKRFVEDIFEYTIGNAGENETTEAILRECVDKFFATREKSLKDKLSELFYPYSEGVSLPLDASLRQSFSDRSKAQFVARLRGILEQKNPDINEIQVVTLSKGLVFEAINEAQNIEDDEFGTAKVVDMMLAYYDTCRRTFTDNVINLAVESCLVQRIPDILSPTQVGEMEAVELRNLVGETKETTERRNHLKGERERLQNGLSTCRSKTKRRTTELPTRPQPRIAQALSSASRPGSRSDQVKVRDGSSSSQVDSHATINGTPRTPDEDEELAVSDADTEL